ALGKIREEAGNTAQALANYQRSLELDNRQEYVASRVAALQGGASALGPSVELGTRIAERSTEPTR
ncbi:MAG: hypothetical protein GX594_13425, partial [Pirellulaceae bacterium]|nr:hypothetical protein [Pirellulaceae bacterium]